VNNFLYFFFKKKKEKKEISLKKLIKIVSKDISKKVKDNKDKHIKKQVKDFVSSILFYKNKIKTN